MIIKDIYCDMDGVTTAFVDPSIQIHGMGGLLADPLFPPVYDYWTTYMGLTDDEFWKPITEGGSAWWRDLPKLEWCDDLISIVERIDPNWRFATKPPDKGGAAARAGKYEWIQKHYPGRVSFMSEDKTDLAGPGRLLIDDAESNCDKWNKRGGLSILVPARTNTLAKYSNPQLTINYIREEFRKLGYANL